LPADQGNPAYSPAFDMVAECIEEHERWHVHDCIFGSTYSASCTHCSIYTVQVACLSARLANCSTPQCLSVMTQELRRVLQNQFAFCASCHAETLPPGTPGYRHPVYRSPYPVGPPLLPVE
jgi:hypothetical protein